MSATVNAVVTPLLASGFSRDEVKLVKPTDFDAKASPDTDILQLEACRRNTPAAIGAKHAAGGR